MTDDRCQTTDVKRCTSRPPYVSEYETEYETTSGCCLLLRLFSNRHLHCHIDIVAYLSLHSAAPRAALSKAKDPERTDPETFPKVAVILKKLLCHC